MGTPIKQGANGLGPPAVHNTTRKNQKNVGQVWKITSFDRQTTLFDGATMEEITQGFSEIRQLNSPFGTAW